MTKPPAGARVGRRRGPWSLVAVSACCLAAAGCMGSWSLRGTRLHYNESFSHTASQEFLLNVVRMRYGETPTFLDLPIINSVTEAKAIGTGAQLADVPTQGVFGGDLGLRDEPTLSYQPRTGANLAESLIEAYTAEILLDVSPGNDRRTFLLAFVDSINGVRNAPTATSPASTVLEPNDDFRHAIDLFTGLEDRGAVKLRVAKRDEEAHGAIPTRNVPGEDMVSAAKEGYVYEAADDRVSLLKRARLLAMTVKPEEIGAADVEEFARVFNLQPGRSVYQIKSQENDEIDMNSVPAAAAVSPEPTDTISMNVRSGYQVLAFLSKGVDVPESHIRRCAATVFRSPDGRPFDGRRLTRSLFHVCVQKHRPLRSDLAVHYRGHWFYIPEDDVQSRATLSLVKMALDLQSQAGSAGPVLTLPLN